MASSSDDSGYVDNWQSGKTVTECNLHMLRTEDYSDVIFRVGPEKDEVRAHRYILVSRSCVFHAMFCGPLAEKGEVTIPDVETSVFKTFLRYLYAEIVDINAENMTGLMYASRKYAVDGLQKKCLAYLEESVTEENVCTIIEQCHEYGELDLEQKALKMIAEGGSSLCASRGFNNLCCKCVGHFLKSDKLRLTEEDVFTAVHRWAQKECYRQNMDPSAHNVRQVLGDLRFQIRFPLMSQRFLAITVGPSGVLSSDERLLIMDGLACQEIDVSPFVSNPRKSQKPIFISRFPDGEVGSGWGYGGNPDALSFTVNVDMEFLGFQLYGPDKGKEGIYELTLKLSDDLNKVIPGVSLPRKSYVLLGEKNLNDVYLSHPVSVEAGRTYTLQLVISGAQTFFGVIGNSSILSDNTEVKFYDSSMSANGTCAQNGQLPGLIFRKL